MDDAALFEVIRQIKWAGPGKLTQVEVDAVNAVLHPAPSRPFDEARFFTTLRALLGPFSQSQVHGFKTVLAATVGAPIAHTAYMLATAWHETKFTMQPVSEAYWLSEEWRKQNLRYYPWYGRGYVQLTWEANYIKADAECTAVGMIKAGQLTADPDVAMRPDVAAFIMRHGMDAGWFTAKKMSDYLPSSGPATLAQFTSARRIINGTDKAEKIAGIAMTMQGALG